MCNTGMCRYEKIEGPSAGQCGMPHGKKCPDDIEPVTEKIAFCIAVDDWHETKSGDMS